MTERDATTDDLTSQPDQAVVAPSSWRAWARWLTRHPFELVTVLLLAFGLAHRYHALPWSPARDVIIMVVGAVYGLAFVFRKWVEEERGFRAERRKRAAG